MLRKLFHSRLWKKSKAPTHDEMFVIRELLEGQDPRLLKVLRQVESAPHVQRELINRSSYQLTLPWTTEDLLIKLDRDVESDVLRTTDESTGRSLEFRVRLLRGGFFGALIGSASDGGDWPRSWALPQVHQRPSRIYLQLPSRVTKGVQDLKSWLGLDNIPENEIELFESATIDDIRNLEIKESITVPAEYRDFLLITNGFDIRDIQVLGTKDTFCAVLGEVSGLVIVSLEEEGAVLIGTDEAFRDKIVRCRPNEKIRKNAILAPSLRSFLRSIVTSDYSKESLI